MKIIAARFAKLCATRDVRADGDVELGLADFAAFNVPSCDACGGLLKPDVIFFGDAVPAAVRDEAAAEVPLLLLLLSGGGGL